MNKLTIRDINLKDKKILVRVDYNVPLTSNGEIADDTRITATLPTIEYIIKNRGVAILISHLGKPKGKVVKELSLRPVAQRLSELLGQEVVFIEDLFSPSLKTTLDQAQGGSVFLLENLRFFPEEEKNDEDFSRYLASLGDIYVNDAFATAHRAHASTYGVAKFSSYAVAGFLMEREISYLSYLLSEPQRPYVAIIGGAKIKDKLGVIKNLISKVDYLLLSGGLVFNFFKVMGYEIGKSIYDSEMEEETKKLIDLNSLKLHLPTDILIANNLTEDAEVKNVKINEILQNWIGVSLGDETTKKYSDIIKQAKTIVWAGPVGIFEVDKFIKASQKIGEAIVSATENGATSVIGGGDTVACLSKLGIKDKVSYVSTGGGATLEFLEGKTLPGIEILNEKK
ncbi:MAG: phosphoglycerate kinase [candidate division WOR-3 bacterium]|nr:phosphoglycerate kinase [candidate division WOR-3 bacterium]MCX7756853.1 phosphoglycerate kinase [candidate division WOR-3 bacterium]MDW7987625.1 phosphoglycerate kinase [candidate division WOR-3 bacterium]